MPHGVCENWPHDLIASAFINADASSARVRCSCGKPCCARTALTDASNDAALSRVDATAAVGASSAAKTTAARTTNEFPPERLIVRYLQRCLGARNLAQCRGRSFVRETRIGTRRENENP